MRHELILGAVGFTLLVVVGGGAITPSLVGLVSFPFVWLAWGKIALSSFVSFLVTAHDS